MKENLVQERKRLTERLEWLGLRSTGSDRIERRLKEIDAEIERYERLERCSI